MQQLDPETVYQLSHARTDTSSRSLRHDQPEMDTAKVGGKHVLAIDDAKACCGDVSDDDVRTSHSLWPRVECRLRQDIHHACLTCLMPDRAKKHAAYLLDR